MILICLGISHRTAPLALRERFCCAPSRLYQTWQEARSRYPQSQIAELALLSTCNRLELYAAVDDSVEECDPEAAVLDLISLCLDDSVHDLEPHLYVHRDHAAAHHLASVAAGLDSQVLGEAQILGQVIDTYTDGVAAGTISLFLSNLFQAAIRAGKRARSETGISRSLVSLSSAAIAAAQQVYPDLPDRRVLIIGAGAMAQLAVKGLLARDVRHIAVANRTLERAQHLAAQAGGEAYSLEDLAAALEAADVVISATGAPQPVVDRRLAEAAAARHPLLFIDIALPRDVDPAVRQLDGVELYDMDDLKRQVDESLARRQAEVPKVRAIIDEETAAFDLAVRRIWLNPVITGMRQKAETIRLRELERAMRRLDGLDDETRQQIESFSRSLVNKLLHDPTVHLKEMADCEEDLNAVVRTVRDLFGLEPPPLTTSHDHH